MLIYHDLSRQSETPTVAALGFFDGVHLGHRAVIAEALCQARKQGAKCAVFTFEPPRNTDRAVSKSDVKLLQSVADRDCLLEELGVELVLCPPFESFYNFTPEEFVREILHNTLNCRGVVCGEDYRFGKKGAGKAALLRQLAEPLGIAVTALAPITWENEPVSSSRIRRCLAEGNTELAGRGPAGAADSAGRCCFLAGRGVERGAGSAGIPWESVKHPPLIRQKRGFFASKRLKSNIF